MFFSNTLRFFASVFIVFFLAACVNSNTISAQKYHEDGLPLWVNEVFTKPTNFWTGYNNEKGYYASGKANYKDEKAATIAAELDAKKRLIDFITGQNETQRISAYLVGVQRVDRFVAKDGTVYVLVFISRKNAKKSLRK